MKTIKFVIVLFIVATTGACEHKKEHHAHDEHQEFKKEIKDLRVKLEATEAQLLNVRSELSNLVNNDSTKTANPN